MVNNIPIYYSHVNGVIVSHFTYLITKWRQIINMYFNIIHKLKKAFSNDTDIYSKYIDEIHSIKTIEYMYGPSTIITNVSTRHKNLFKFTNNIKSFIVLINSCDDIYEYRNNKKKPMSIPIDLFLTKGGSRYDCLNKTLEEFKEFTIKLILLVNELEYDLNDSKKQENYFRVVKSELEDTMTVVRSIISNYKINNR